jgi:polyphosphate kinase
VGKSLFIHPIVALAGYLLTHLLDLIPHKKLRREKVKLPPRSRKRAYDDVAALEGRRFVPEKY